jgi:hypothetical protein
MGVTVGVLLPVRIETRFSTGRLRLRVVPDEPWFARHDPRVSAGEVEAVQRYLAAPAGTEPEQEQAWRDLAAAVGGPRAAYLARRLVVTAADGKRSVVDVPAEQLRVDPAFPRIEGFPDKLHVWLARGGAAPVEILTLTVDANHLLMDFPDPEAPADRRWWEQWDEAVKAGLAGEVALPGDPSDIDVLYVTGLGDGKPAALFADHRDAGRVGLLAPGEPTNTVDGAPAASVGQDPLAWRRVLLDPPTATDRAVSAALTGDPATLGTLPGTSEPHQRWNGGMVAALWPALWGFAGQDVWAMPGGIEEAAAWAPGALLPEGPFPTLRVGSQPYGLLPASVPERWVASPKDPPVEAVLSDPLLRLRDEYAAAAETRGTVAGASTDQLLDLIGQLPTSPLFRHRLALPLELWWLILLSLYGVGWNDFDRAWHLRHQEADALGLHPARRYGTVGTPQRLGIPLVVPAKLPPGTRVADLIKRLVEIAWRTPWIYSNTDNLVRELLRVPPESLLLRLAIRSIQVALGDIGRALSGATPPGPEPLARDASRSGQLQQWISAVSIPALSAPTPQARRFAAVTDGLLVLTEMTDERLERLLRATVDTAAYRIDPWLLGAPTRRLRELVDAGEAEPRLGVFGWVDMPRPGTPGPTPAGLIHTPSPAQALVATVLRDRAVNDGSARWDLDLTSRKVRDADRIAEHVRIGAHLAEALGREVERVVAKPDDVSRLRRDFRLRTEQDGRRVCDGLAVLAAPPASLGLDADRLAGLDRLRTAMDAYGDILVAEAVHHVTEGRAEVAGAVMDAAAGLARPPQLGVLRTPREGRSVLTSVVVALRAVEPPGPAADVLDAVSVSPATLADASVAAFVADQLGGASTWTFTAAGGTVTLADLGLQPIDALALSRTDLERLAAEAAGSAITGGSAIGKYEAAARLVALVGRRAAGPDALTERADAVVDTAPIEADLLARYTRIRDTAAALVARLASELGAAEPVSGVLGRLVRAARGWGIAPDPTPGATLVDVATRALDLLGARVTAAPAPAIKRDDLVEAMAALVSPTRQLAITGTLSAASLPTAAFADDEWLPVVSAVRESVARVEAHQLAAGTPAGAGNPLAGLSNKPGDPWQIDAADGRRMVVAYTGPGIVPTDEFVAVAVVDRFAEVIPAEEQTTAVTFGFDAPAARAAQAILLAVPPDLGKPLDEATVLDIIAGARRLAHARVARPADLSVGLRGILPASLLPATGLTRVTL